VFWVAIFIASHSQQIVLANAYPKLFIANPFLQNVIILQYFIVSKFRSFPILYFEN
jgi:hypothetical protein